MTQKEFSQFQALLLSDTVVIRERKGREYGTDNDAFANFQEDARDNGISRLQAASMHLYKHMRAIKSYVRMEDRDKQMPSSEPIRGRIIDAINYLTLIAGMIEEKNLDAKLYLPSVEATYIPADAMLRCIVCSKGITIGERCCLKVGVGYLHLACKKDIIETAKLDDAYQYVSKE